MPWVGFPLRKLVALARPFPAAAYVRFESYSNRTMEPTVRDNPEGFAGAPWPYVEGLTLAEATHDLAFVSFGLYNRTLPPQNGAPIRLTLPWKYGFKVRGRAPHAAQA